jgi:hypothetical protein
MIVVRCTFKDRTKALLFSPSCPLFLLLSRVLFVHVAYAHMQAIPINYLLLHLYWFYLLLQHLLHSTNSHMLFLSVVCLSALSSFPCYSCALAMFISHLSLSHLSDLSPCSSITNLYIPLSFVQLPIQFQPLLPTLDLLPPWILCNHQEAMMYKIYEWLSSNSLSSRSLAL